MNLIYFTQEAYKILTQDIPINQEKYYSETLWLKEYFERNGNQEFYKESTIKVGEFEFQYTGDDNDSKNADDLQNTINLYSAYEDKVTPTLATDPCLWTALCHMIPSYKKYILRRWTKDDGEVSIVDRFFSSGSRNSLLYFNAISRLWWSGYLTYDENKKRTNPWELTRILFSAQQIQKDLFDQPFSMNKEITKGLLRALKCVQEETGNNATIPFRKCCHSYLNHYGAVTILDALSSEEIEEIAYKYMKSIVSL